MTGQDLIDTLAEVKAQGRRECEATHAALSAAAYERGMENTQAYVNDARDRALSRGRLQGAVVIGVLVAVACWLGKRGR